MMSVDSRISLLDLSKQFNFEIDDDIKKKICFAETLVISCGHCEGDVKDDSSESDWTCDDSSESKISDTGKQDKSVDKTLVQLEEEPQKEAVEEEEDFHFYFFPDCAKPIPPKDSNDSLIIEDGFPKIKKSKKKPDICTCAVDKSGKCPCHLKVPCECGAKTRDDCTCNKVDNICICEEGNPRIVCVCKPSNVCLCHPDGQPRPICTCSEVKKPCICQRDKYPFPICVCEFKPNVYTDLKIIKHEEFGEESLTGETKSSSTEKSEPIKEPCTCQKPPPDPVCYCNKGKECVCEKNLCICGVQPTCICEPTESGAIVCEGEDSKAICICPKDKECTCYAKSPEDCDCFPKPQTCTCGNAENCVCFSICECTEPCLCDLAPKKEEICTCIGNTKEIAGGLVCTCNTKKDENNKLKRVRAGKHGYRWCHDVDPKHTFFGYSYDKHDKISTKQQDREKLKILGLHDTSVEEEVCAIHGASLPTFKKKVKKPSLDCCSAVGGISISVETLGEDKDKFLVQVVSHACKEGTKTGTKLVGILDCNLHTLEENRTEHITKKNLTKEHRSYTAICDGGYYNKVTRICGERHFVKRFYHSFQDARNFLLEGANVVLLRYFSINRFSGNIRTNTVLIDGTICESVYVSHGVSHGVVNGKPLLVVKVERHIIEPSGFIHQTLTVLTLRGYMVSHEWTDTPYIFHINPLLRVVSEKDEIEPHEPLREKWRNDLQLLSDYLDCKSTRTSEGCKYTSEMGQLSGVIRDYLQTLLMLRPHDALHFTRHYFGSALSALDLPHDEYFDPCTKHVRYYFFEE